MSEESEGWAKTPILQWLKIEDIKIPPKRLRSHFGSFKDRLFGLSIKNGLLQPIHVVEDDEGMRWLVDGENRLKAWIKEGHSTIPAIVKKGDRIDAILGSAKHNVLRGKVNPAELAELVAYLHDDFRLSYEKISAELCLSEGYLSKLVAIARDEDALEKVRNGEISLKEAYNRLIGFTVKPISEEKAPFWEISSKKGVSEEPTIPALTKREPLSDEDLGLTTSFRQAMEENKRFKPLGPEEEEEERRGRCAYCGGYFTSKNEITFIAVHKKECKRKVWDLIIEAEREAQNESSQP